MFDIFENTLPAKMYFPAHIRTYQTCMALLPTQQNNALKHFCFRKCRCFFRLISYRTEKSRITRQLWSNYMTQQTFPKHKMGSGQSRGKNDTQT